MAEPRSPPASPRPTSETLGFERFPYNETFQNELAEIVSDPHSQMDDGITILPNNSSSKAASQANCMRLADVDVAQLPAIPRSELPLPLDDPRRKYSSPWPGVKLTHPGGAIEGGAGSTPLLRSEAPDGRTVLTPDPRDVTFARDLIIKNGIRNQTQLRKHVDKTVREYTEQLQKTMQARKDALSHNARIDAEIKHLEDQRSLERKIEARMKQEKKEKR